jgi:hypothetical protein
MTGVVPFRIVRIVCLFTSGLGGLTAFAFRRGFTQVASKPAPKRQSTPEFLGSRGGA